MTSLFIRKVWSANMRIFKDQVLSVSWNSPKRPGSHKDYEHSFNTPTAGRTQEIAPTSLVKVSS